jgi:hypothetical protein
MIEDSPLVIVLIGIGLGCLEWWLDSNRSSK